ncbi:MAG: sulfatase-like hydrolase/transferase [Desulfarculaceae bacterium]|nr:sulfatase-like hydrolase/transferase [Desulfarculaceae bacterium]MCF8071118.1 sulfatase-like hydrolase/transferase [Desulfarculaceae bacterium]MCF8101279.1 sulfatase-like hydrolase/transferase [Desulfarculaceae bacterium]MCF8115172.1 sulfatase-like hydrolase/transferase [Desulfarculaceae bacterium]
MGTAGNKRPNIVLIITDQQRQAQHWPDGWLEAHMPTMARLQNNGVTFTNNFAAATACCPSRASFLTGVYPSVHGVYNTPPNPILRSDITNIFKLAEQAGYEVVYKGKMHLFTPQSNPSTTNFTSYDIKWASDNYRMNRWNPPDDATDVGATVYMAGGWPNNDARYVSGVPDTFNRMTPAVGKSESIFQYLDNHDTKGDKPFLLVCSFGNPHDISIWPDQNKWGYNQADYKNLTEIGLPSNYKDDLKEKPIGQTWIKKLCDKAFPCSDDQDRIEYCRFYAHLHSVVDKQIAAVLDKLDQKGLTDDTIIFRFADHGEQSFSHELQQKSVNSYEESINVPLIISNPKLFPNGTTTSSFASLIDLVPTVAEITGAASPAELKSMGICGKSLVPIMRDPNASVRDNIMLYTEDVQYFFDEFLGKKNFYQTMPGRIRSIRFEDWMYAVYFTDKGTQIQYEMYNLTDDPGEMTNLAWGSRMRANHKQMQQLHDRLTAELETYQALPKGFQWPAKAGTESV